MAKIVAVGGGTGLSILLRGLKEVSTEITAVVTVADDGGGSGVLREDLGMLPPGDVRNCILALANEEPVLQDLFQFRFQEGRLKGQNFGNLMIAAMTGISESFSSAIKKTSDIFAITGEVFPVSEDDLVLYAKLTDGTTIVGESNIPLEAIKRDKPIDKIWIEPSDARTHATIIDRIKNADVITIGPGSLYTSIIPNLLVDGIVEAINTCHAEVFYVCNMMTQPGETDNMTAGDHLKAIFKHTKLRKIHYIIVDSGEIDSEAKDRYKSEYAEHVVVTADDKIWFATNTIEMIEGHFIDIKKGYIRHDALKISQEIINHVERNYEKQ